MKKYIFKSKRLGFRTWNSADLDAFAAINQDSEVMHFFQNPYTVEESRDRMKLMNSNFEKDNFCYFAVDFLETGELAGTLGMGRKTFPASFTPCIDIGWRFGKNYWNLGLATEGALACLEYARSLGIEQIHSYASTANKASTRVMEKIGMEFLEEFVHQELQDSPHLQPFSAYKITL
ncbi:GNAT family N-acetyltransferase [Algoriphagus zhangzhouensis]|uniref:Protein N-acetyltransferase, RimJ/RimL family n=1 Tax=Algoriphagus zhangzhouensis TaxID=1073327 RepID=A0A1M7Z6V5_9BACT|nr:GNAT family N-acetyltransferase [Algoriphagus zhangzhouensis]TDY49201.1 RimJ/RimL family protein N-acetyltransferase [Algoriphagus zhangzhouensis]SHO60584.1 Protein N-acetyltransferase, RimJ/RimL family [Algoriphagus zhangzhouensis]